jgi:hypothetical protein
MLQKNMLRRIFQSERKEIIGAWREIHTEDSHSVPNMIWVNKLRSVQREEHRADVGCICKPYNNLVAKAETAGNLWVRGVDWRIILKWAIRKHDVMI